MSNPETQANPPVEPSTSQPGVSRRQMLLGTSVAAALGLGAGLGGGMFLGGRAPQVNAGADVLNQRHEFRGKHQSGIITPAQQQMHTVAFDVTTTRKSDLIALFKEWTLAAERMMNGNLVGEHKTFRDVPPDDTGETMDMGPAALTITFGVGATLFFDEKDHDRFGLGQKMPKPLALGIPRMAAEKLDEQHSHGDLIIQACAEDPMVAMHAIHNLTRIAFGRASVRWTQLGYGRTSSTSTAQATPRNLFGFKDGTSNIKGEEAESELDKQLWIQPSDEAGAWAAGGTYLCIRKIKQMMEVWDELILSEQENIIGRDKLVGAPLSGGQEFTAPDFAKTGKDGAPLIDPLSHVSKVHPDHHGGKRMLRRGYNYMEGNDKLGRLEGGLFFIAFVRDPQTHFVPALAAMRSDLMTEYLQHIATGLFLILPGLQAGEEYLGQSLFA